ncbi:MAG: hypothetical protein WCC90_07535 [Methylocella sp.]
MEKAMDSLARGAPVGLAALFRLQLYSSAYEPPMYAGRRRSLLTRVNGSQDAVVSQFEFQRWVGSRHPGFLRLPEPILLKNSIFCRDHNS